MVVSAKTAPIFQKAGVPFISAYGVHPDITRSGNYVFRGVHLGPPQGRAGAKFLGDNLGLKRVSIVTMDNDYHPNPGSTMLSVAAAVFLEGLMATKRATRTKRRTWSKADV